MSAGKSEHAWQQEQIEALKSENALLHQRCGRMEREHKALLGENERLRAECDDGEVRGVWTLGAAKTLSLLLEQEYKRGYIAGHDEGFCK